MKITGVGDISFFSGSSASASDIFAWILLFFVYYLYYTSFIFIQILILRRIWKSWRFINYFKASKWLKFISWFIVL